VFDADADADADADVMCRLKYTLLAIDMSICIFNNAFGTENAAVLGPGGPLILKKICYEQQGMMAQALEVMLFLVREAPKCFGAESVTMSRMEAELRRLTKLVRRDEVCRRWLRERVAYGSTGEGGVDADASMCAVWTAGADVHGVHAVQRMHCSGGGGAQCERVALCGQGPRVFGTPHIGWTREAMLINAGAHRSRGSGVV
jgi:hypothetical protein